MYMLLTKAVHLFQVTETWFGVLFTAELNMISLFQYRRFVLKILIYLLILVSVFAVVFDIS